MMSSVLGPMVVSGHHGIGHDRICLQHLEQLREHVAYGVSAKLDRVKLSVRHAAMWMTVDCVGLLATVSVIVTTIVLLLTGLAAGLAPAFDGRL